MEVGTNTKTVSANLRKSPSDLTDRSIKNVTTKVITSVQGVVGERNSLYFLRSAVKILDFKKRKREVLEQDEIEQDSSGDESGNDDCSEYELYKNDDRLIAALTALPPKYIVYSPDDMKKVLEIFEVVKTMISEKNTRGVLSKSATLTVNVLSENSYYSQLTGRTVLRWYETRNNECDKPGRKIDENFEAEVWGKLMLCIFEIKNENVSRIYTIKLFHLSYYDIHDIDIDIF